MMGKIEGKLQGKSSSGKAYRINGKWVAISQMTNIKIEGENISADIPEWLMKKLSDEKPKDKKPYNKSSSNKYVKGEKTYVEDKKDYIPIQIYTNCVRCNKVGFVSTKSKLCVCCILDKANNNTAADRIKFNKSKITKLEEESEADKAKWRKYYQEQEQRELEQGDII